MWLLVIVSVGFGLAALMAGRRRRVGLTVALALAAIIAALGAAPHLPRKFHHEPGVARNACVANLSRIQSAKEAWARRLGKETPAVPRLDDLITPDGPLPKNHSCPAGGEYFVNDLQTKAACSLAAQGHVLP